MFDVSQILKSDDQQKQKKKNNLANTDMQGDDMGAQEGFMK